MKLHQITIDRESLKSEVVYKYGDAHAGFRELIQNAKDAILDYRELNPKHNGTITVNIFPNLVEVTDDGIGLNTKEADNFLLKMYGTSKDRTRRDRAGVFGRGFFAIFKEAEEVFVFTRRQNESPVFLRIYPQENWFIAEEMSLNEVPTKTLSYVRRCGAHGSVILCYPRTGFHTDGIYNYLTQTCQFFDIPIIINGAKINVSFEETLQKRGSRAIVTFNKMGITGALGYQANDNMIQTFVYNIKILNLISPESGVNGFINFDKLEVTPSRDALVQNSNYKLFIQVLTEMCNAVLKKLSEDPSPDDYQRLLDFAHNTSNPRILDHIPIFKLVGVEEKVCLRDLLKLAKPKRVIFVADERTFIADRLKKRSYVVVHELTPRLKEMLTLAIRNRGMTVSTVDSAFARKLSGCMDPRRIVPEAELTENERKLLDIVRSMVKSNIKVDIMEGDPFDDAEHVPGVIRLQRHSELLGLALDPDIISYPFMVKVILIPLIAHEITHEEATEIHDECFYEIYEIILKDMHKKLFDEFKTLIKKQEL